MKKFLIAAILAATTVTASAASATTVWIEPGVHLNARSGPSTHYDVLGTFNPCTKVHAVKRHGSWIKVAFKGHYYWVSAKYLQDHDCGYNSYKPRKKHYKNSHRNSYGY
ncbi:MULTISPECIES: SH3 domain-containing protein [unclassified Marinovum]